MPATERRLGKRKRIALVAHDHKKADLIDWATYNKEVLARHELFATGTTGKMLEDTLDRTVKKLLSGPLGGDQQIGSMIATGDIDVMIFFWDPMEAQPHDSDVKALLRLGVTALLLLPWLCSWACGCCAPPGAARRSCTQVTGSSYHCRSMEGE